MNAIPQAPNQAGKLLALIAEALARQPANDAREHFPSLRARTRRLHKDFLVALHSADVLIADWCRALENDTAVVDAFKEPSSDQEPFRRIAPILAKNFQRIARTLSNTTEPAEPVTTIEELYKIVPKFEDFINLGAAVRQYIDLLVETSYQLVALDAAKFNYKFLESLVSFAPVAPASLHQSLYSDALQSIITEFTAMSGGKRKNSAFSSNEHSQFGDRVMWLVERLSATQHIQTSLKLTFKFCSDFVHLGYASNIALAHTNAPQIVAGAGDYYTAPILNFAELRLRLVGECVRYYSEVFVPTLVSTFEATLVDPDELILRARQIEQNLNNVRLYLGSSTSIIFIKDGVIESNQPICIECGFCATSLKWEAPHYAWDCYCDGCGQQFQAEIVPEAVDYIVSSKGFSKVNGSDALEITELAVPLRQKLEAIRHRHFLVRAEESLSYVSITDLQYVNVDTLGVPTVCTSRPDGKFPIRAYAASKALERQSEVVISCNCGAEAIYKTATRSNICHCRACQTSIGIFGVSGNATKVNVMDVPGGPPLFVPIHGARSTRLRNDQT